MIVSASYRTDIPAFRASWFAERWRDGFVLAKNPYSGKPYRVGLNPAEVDGIVFWTRWAAPFGNCLETVAGNGVPFVVQYTITGYGAALEPGVPDWRRAADSFCEIAERHGPNRAVWRYDPILLSAATPWDSHLSRFEGIADRIAGATDEVVVSFAQFYAKTRRGLAAHAASDPGDADKRALLAALRDAAAKRGLKISLCAQPHLIVDGVAEAACIDAERLSRVAGRPIAAKAKPHRPACRCVQSRDIGAYATCGFGCAYCYAR
jgi:hypothetical protein